MKSFLSSFIFFLLDFFSSFSFSLFFLRSNVGKSSLIDNLLGNKKLGLIISNTFLLFLFTSFFHHLNCSVSCLVVVTSKEPGCTKSINYYLLQSKSGVKEAYIVDLPGYGFAKISKEERSKWDQMIKDYLLARDISVLRFDLIRIIHFIFLLYFEYLCSACSRVYLLIDSRRGPNEDDCEMIELLTRASITHQVNY